MLSFKLLEQKLAEKGIPKFRAAQVLQAVWKEGKASYDQINTLPALLRKDLEVQAPIFSLNPVRTIRSTDGTVIKTLFETHDKQKIEAVLMRFQDGRHTICVSSQAGCQLGCKFCATGTLKFGRNLTYEEIADQVLYFAQELHKTNENISNIVYMGMGEPFMNYDEVLESVRVINHKHCLNLGARHITLSTSGICEGIEKLANEDIQVNLAISLHAPNQELRERIMPIARKYKLSQLMDAVNDYLTKTNRRISYEYVMLKGINDSAKEAHELAELAKGQLVHVNMIPYNSTDIKGIEKSEKSDILKFRDILLQEGIPATIRVTLGQEIAAACGQLANKAAQPKEQ